MITRPDGRTATDLRSLSFELTPVRYPEGSTIVKMGETHVLCAVSVAYRTPRWKQSGGWLTAEYALLPGSTQTRTSRRHIQGGRAQEIRRMIGRSLRAAVDLDLLGERTITVDCDVLQADGGTRTAAITGGYVALALALHHLILSDKIPPDALRPPVAAVSVGMVGGEPRLDLMYAEDNTADVDLNVAMDAQERFIEVQGAAEGEPIARPTLDTLLDLAATGIQDIIQAQREALACAGIEI